MFVQSAEVKFPQHIFSNSDLRKRICAPTFLMDVLMDKVQCLHDRDEVLCLILLNE